MFDGTLHVRNLDQKFRYKELPLINHSYCQKTRMIDFAYTIKCG